MRIRQAHAAVQHGETALGERAFVPTVSEDKERNCGPAFGAAANTVRGRFVRHCGYENPAASAKAQRKIRSGGADFFEEFRRCAAEIHRRGKRKQTLVRIAKRSLYLFGG